MKNSGIEWIGEIPDNWEIIPNKYLFENHSVKVGATWDKYKLLSLTTMGVKEKDSSVAGGKVPDSYENYQTVVPGDMIFCLFDLDCSAVFSGVSPYHGMITSAYDVYEINKKLADNLYVDYLFQYAFSNRYYKIYSKNIRYTVTTEMFKSIRTPIPPLDTQMKIGTLLSNKCSKVDKLIDVQQAQIEKLKEYKQSVITEAVTKGLDPSAPMKDSEIEWATRIPKHWRVMPNKYIMTKEKMICPAYNGGKIMSLTVNGVIVRDLGAGGKMPLSFDGYQLIYKGNLLMCLFDIDVTPRCVGIIEQDGITSPAYSQFKLKDIAFAKYYYYYFLMLDYTKELLPFAKNLRHSLTEEQFGFIEHIVPPLIEQQQIAEYLDDRCAKIDKLIALKQEKIEKLNEYKKSLIYEYVTGKKEVV